MRSYILTAAEQDFIRKLGASRHAVLLYGHLLKSGPLTAREAASMTGELPSAEYRLFRQLEAMGLVRRGSGRPIMFTAVPKDIGLKTAYVHFRSAVEDMLKQIAVPQDDKYHIEMVVGRQALYDKYEELAAGSNQEICIFAIGIAYSKALERSQKAALQRGVRIRHVLQQIKPSNFHVFHKWQQLGVQVRYAESERGFHLMLFDSRILLISFSDPNDTDDRISILTNNPVAVRLFKAEFEHVWSGAQRVKA